MRRAKLFALFLPLGLFVSVWPVLYAQRNSQVAPLTLAQILTGLQTKGVTAETRTLAARNQYIARRVRERGVTFRLTEEFESEIRRAGASEELIKAIRENSPPLPKPTPTPTPPPQPKPTPASRPSSQSFAEVLGYGVKLEIVRLPGGTFQMGSSDGANDEKPVHRVTISPFFIGKYEVTQAQWRAVMGNNPSYFKGDHLPVENVSWDDAMEFCRKLSKWFGKTYRLPTEAEWEYACRAGTATAFAFGSSLSSTQANFNGNYPYGGAAYGIYRHSTTPAGIFSPNNFGLYDLHGNVWEWCQDWYNKDYYRQSAENNPQGPTTGTVRALRGGSWEASGDHCRSAYRDGFEPDLRSSYIGFRVVVSAKPQ
jgi:formylglycine-generating enzyme required for sulfatase activity